MIKSDQEACDELSLYTLGLRDPYFIHQHIVDAYAAQHSDKNLKLITNAFALIGLYLMLEKGYTGKQVQDAHGQLARRRKDWPHFSAPKETADISVHDVLNTSPGGERDEMIRKWCLSVWNIWHNDHQQIADLVKHELFRED